MTLPTKNGSGQPGFSLYGNYSAWFNQWGVVELSFCWATVPHNLIVSVWLLWGKSFRNGSLAHTAWTWVWRCFVEFCNIWTGGSPQKSERAGQSGGAPTGLYTDCWVESTKAPYKLVVWCFHSTNNTLWNMRTLQDNSEDSSNEH